MQETWSRIERWLEKNAPRLLAELQPGATDEQIAETEQKLGVSLPDDLKASFRVHNGQPRDGFFFFPRGEFLALESIVQEWTVWKELLDGGDFNDFQSRPLGPIKDNWWNARWIPLTYDGAGNHLCADLDPAHGGNVGQIITMWHDADDREVVAPSFSDFLNGLADKLESGEITYSEENNNLVER